MQHGVNVVLGAAARTEITRSGATPQRNSCRWTRRARETPRRLGSSMADHAAAADSDPPRDRCTLPAVCFKLVTLDWWASVYFCRFRDLVVRVCFCTLCNVCVATCLCAVCNCRHEPLMLSTRLIPTQRLFLALASARQNQSEFAEPEEL